MNMVVDWYYGVEEDIVGISAVRAAVEEASSPSATLVEASLTVPHADVPYDVAMAKSSSDGH